MKRLLFILPVLALVGCGPSPEEIAARERAEAEQKYNQHKFDAMAAINRAPFPCGEIIRLEIDFANRAHCSNGEVYIIRYVSAMRQDMAMSCSAFDDPVVQKQLRRQGYNVTKKDCINGSSIAAFRAIMYTLGFVEDEYGRFKKP